MTEEQLEHLKHGLRIREILLDKLGLAVLLGVLLFAANWRMKTYESKLQTQLDQLKEVYNFQRILAEKDIAALEEVWKGLATFRHKANTYVGKPATEKTVGEVQAAALDLVHVADSNQIYLRDATSAAVSELTSKSLNEFAEKWERDGPQGLSERTLEFLANAIQGVRAQIQADIRARRASPQTPPTTSAP